MLRQIHVTKPQSLLVGFHPIVLKMNSRALSHCLNYRPHAKMFPLLRASSDSCLSMICPVPLLSGNKGAKNLSRGICLGNGLRNCLLIRARSFSSANNSPKVAEGNGKTLPWLAKARERHVKKSEKIVTDKTSRSSWEESADKFLKVGGERGFQGVETKPIDRMARDDSVEEEDAGSVDDPRWDRIKNRAERFAEVKQGSNRPELRKWDKQDNWGKRTWKEATESTVPRVVGEGIYGVGPVLAALSAGRREFYCLYIQEGMELSGNNRKKKDKKGFEKVLRMADQTGLSQREVSKHDLNMVVDNRPHQGLVLDASPLEMVGIKELEPVSVDEEGSPLWVALDEVTDPQNLGAIIRSAYFFGASGVVLCAKNSAPLSGVVSKASAGSLELMELRSCKNMMQFLTSSANNGWRVLGGSVSSRAISLNDVTPGAPTILVLGSEGTGLRPLVERSCTQLIRIPGNTPLSLINGEDEDTESVEMDRGLPDQEFRSFLAVESLNVSVAAGVLLHHLTGSNYNNNEPLKKQTDML